MLEYEGKISEETIEKEKLMDISYQIRKAGLSDIRLELKKNPNAYERTCFSSREISVYYRKLKFLSGIFSVFFFIIII